MTLNDIIDLNLLNRFLTNLRSLFATKSEVAAKPTGKIYYGTCSTTANTYIKEATVDTFPLDEDNKPLVGTVVAIKYTVTNTYKTEGQTYALNVNNTGTYPMYYNNAAVTTSTSANTLVAGYKNRHVFYVFNGTQWVWLSASYDTNTTYSGMTQVEVDAGTGTTARLITPARLRDNFYTEDEVDTLLGSKANSNDLATVATSGSYNDLSNKPTIPAAQVNSDWNASFGVAQILNKPTIPTVPTALSAFTDDLGSNPTHTHSQYLTSAPVTSVNGQTGAVSLTIPAAVTESTVSGWGFTKNTGNVGSTTVSSIVTLTEAQYEALSTKDSSTLYIITSS